MNRIEIASIYPAVATSASSSFNESDFGEHISWENGAFTNEERSFTGINQQTGEVCESLFGTSNKGSEWPDGYYKIEARQYETSSYNVGAGSNVRTGKYIVRNTANLFWNKSLISWMTYIAPGSFMMGSPVGELGRSSNETVHRVTLTKGFYLGRIPCTNALYNVLNSISSTGDNKPKVYIKYANYNADGRIYWAGEVYDRGSLPEGYIAYPYLYESTSGSETTTGGLITRLNTSYSVSGYSWELPTEAQWEYACRAGTSTAFNNGLNLDKRTKNETNVDADDNVWQRNIDEICWYSKNKPASALQVAGLKRPNAWGLYDMHGNVWEWCKDWYGGDYSAAPVTDPTGPASGSYRCIRGGSFIDTARYCRAAGIRNSSYPSNYYSGIGFRLALVPSTP